jgi:outer membrane protein insertion porin family
VKRLALIAALAACGGPVARPVGPAPVGEPAKVAAPAPAAAVAWDKLVGPIRAVEVTSSDATLVPAARELLAAEVGHPLDRFRLRGVLARLLVARGVGDVTARGIQRADGITLVVELAPQPSVHALAAREAGGTEVAVPGQLSFSLGLPLDPAMIDAIADQMRERYLERGFVDVAVDWRTKPAAGGQVDVTIEIVPGKAVIVDAVEFRGNTHVGKAELTKVLVGELTAGSPWLDDKVTRARLLLTSYYYDHGFINVSIDDPKPAGEHTTLVFPIREGDQYKIGKVELKGLLVADAKKYLPLLGTKRGDVFNRSTIASGLVKIQEAAKAAGQGDVVVTPLTNIDPAKKLVDLTLDVGK